MEATGICFSMLGEYINDYFKSKELILIDKIDRYEESSVLKKQETIFKKLESKAVSRSPHNFRTLAIKKEDALKSLQFKFETLTIESLKDSVLHSPEKENPSNKFRIRKDSFAIPKKLVYGHSRNGSAIENSRKKLESPDKTIETNSLSELSISSSKGGNTNNIGTTPQNVRKQLPRKLKTRLFNRTPTEEAERFIKSYYNNNYKKHEKQFFDHRNSLKAYMPTIKENIKRINKSVLITNSPSPVKIFKQRAVARTSHSTKVVRPFHMNKDKTEPYSKSFNFSFDFNPPNTFNKEKEKNKSLTPDITRKPQKYIQTIPELYEF
jgi:hypothetical protein